ncbi:MAG TPA: hypothetical protein PLE99_02730 [Candidatus Thiothrix moscowensis]|uniref:hypothetical protein n=1 Tax=unclassified Thiothrix TaxID=2636184 RepID=UPI0025F527CC|nr:MULTISPECIES: hypothetical protein [unclassified Thiothrix]HRJ51657.1 hypothetical protein [Candidatus Thiothrix moscowensis]HRJ91972.1 hypothetical protein [Candidatus Thiothrix moscowensis]
MFDWMVNRLIDVLLVFVLATVVLWWGAVRYPELFPAAFYHYWGVAMPVAEAPVTAPPVTAQVQR